MANDHCSERVVYVTLIEAPRERVWQALTSAEFTQAYWHNTHVQSSWVVGEPVQFLVYPHRESEPKAGCTGEVLECDPPSRLCYTWGFPRNPEVCDEAPSRVAFTLAELPGGVTKLTLVHDQFPEGSKMYPMVDSGWPFVLSGLKTLLETGRATDFSALMEQ